MDRDASGIVLVHGGMCPASCWDPVLEHLSAPVRAVDLPGRGQNPADIMTVTLDDCVQSVMEAADHEGWERFVLVGHSLGGVTVTETAWRHPLRVARIVYVGALIPAPGQSGCEAQSGADWPTDQLVTIDHDIARHIFGNDMNDDEWVRVWPTFGAESPKLMNARLSGYPQNVPTTYVTLTEDVVVPPALCDEMVGRLDSPVDRREMAAGHMVMFTKPAELAAVLSSVVTAR